MAEREGFEPPVAFRLRLISSQVHSTGLCHLSVFVYNALRYILSLPFRDYDADYADYDVAHSVIHKRANQLHVRMSIPLGGRQVVGNRMS